jgi:phage shock protein C
MEQNIAPGRLYRSRSEKMVFGVAGGLAGYLGVDPALVRLAFVLTTMVHCIGLLAYLILAVVVPLRPTGEAESSVPALQAYPGRNKQIVGFLLIGAGLLVLMGNLGIWRFLDWGLFWPLGLVVVGLLLLTKAWRREGDI